MLNLHSIKKLISKICLYDEHRRLVGDVLATPIRKTEAKEYLFKMKIDAIS